jgi:hypothetical protein
VFPGATKRTDDEYEIPPLDLVALNRGIATLLERGILVSSVRPAHSVLEQHFREAVGE